MTNPSPQAASAATSRTMTIVTKLQPSARGRLLINQVIVNGLHPGRKFL